MKKLIPILFALVLLLVLLPSPEARAYTDGDECPDCHSTFTHWYSGPVNHWFGCGSCGWEATHEPHIGGTATCVESKVCVVCGIHYDEKDPDNHAGGTEVRDAKEATCTEAG